MLIFRDLENMRHLGGKMTVKKSGYSFNKPGSETQEEVGLGSELGSLRAVVDAVIKPFKCYSRNCFNHS